MGQSRPANSTHIVRYQATAVVAVNGCCVVDTESGAVKFLTPLKPQGEPSPWGAPFEQAR